MWLLPSYHIVDIFCLSGSTLNPHISLTQKSMDMAAWCTPSSVKCALTRFISFSSSVSSGSRWGGDRPYAPLLQMWERGEEAGVERRRYILAEARLCSVALGGNNVPLSSPPLAKAARDTEGEEVRREKKKRKRKRRRCSILAHTPPLSSPSGRQAIWHNWLLISLQPALNLCGCVCVYGWPRIHSKLCEHACVPAPMWPLVHVCVWKKVSGLRPWNALQEILEDAVWSNHIWSDICGFRIFKHVVSSSACVLSLWLACHMFMSC